MSEYEAYETPVTYPWGSTSLKPGHRSSRDEAGVPDSPVVLARVPDMEAITRSSLRVADTGAESEGRGWFAGLFARLRGISNVSGFSTQSMWAIGAVMVLVGVGGFLLGRASRPEPVAQSDVWCLPPPPAASAPEAPAWNGGSVATPPATQANLEWSAPAFDGGPSAAVTPTGAVLPAETSTPWTPPAETASTPSTNSRDALNQTQTGANRGMTLDAPTTPGNDYRTATPWTPQYPSTTR